MKELEFITKILHTKFLKEDPHGSLRMPVYDNVAFEFKTAEDLEAAFMGKIPAHMYSRITNPTVEDFEERVRNVTGALGVIAVSSGMAAISNVILSVCRQGDNIVTSRHLFGNTYSLFEQTLKPWGLEVKYADMTDPAKAISCIDKRTRAVFLETITNPQLEVADIEELSREVRKKGVLVVADTTVTPPYLFCSKEHGVDIEVLSTTKYISGGATSVGGLIIDNGTYDWKKNPKFAEDAVKFGPYAFIGRTRREVYRNLGACLAPHNAYLQSLGMETLPLRAGVSCANALAIAEYLEKTEVVKKVNYPALQSSPWNRTAKKQFGKNTGALVTFDLASKEECFRFLNKLKLVKRSTNLNDNRTLALHPASTIFCEYSPERKQEMDVRETMIRLAVGIEDVRDIIDDIAEALEELK